MDYLLKRRPWLYPHVGAFDSRPLPRRCLGSRHWDFQLNLDMLLFDLQGKTARLISGSNWQFLPFVLDWIDGLYSSNHGHRR